MSNKSILIWLALIFILLVLLLFLNIPFDTEQTPEKVDYTDIEQDEEIIIPDKFIGNKRIFGGKS